MPSPCALQLHRQGIKASHAISAAMQPCARCATTPRSCTHGGPAAGAAPCSTLGLSICTNPCALFQASQHQLAAMLSKATRSLGLAGAGALKQTLPAACAALSTTRRARAVAGAKKCRVCWVWMGQSPPAGGRRRQRLRSLPLLTRTRRSMEAAQAQASGKEDKRPDFPMPRPRAGDPPKEVRGLAGDGRVGCGAQGLVGWQLRSPLVSTSNSLALHPRRSMPSCATSARCPRPSCGTVGGASSRGARGRGFRAGRQGVRAPAAPRPVRPAPRPPHAPPPLPPPGSSIWLVTKHADLVQVLQDNRFSKARGGVGGGWVLCWWRHAWGGVAPGRCLAAAWIGPCVFPASHTTAHKPRPPGSHPRGEIAAG